MVSYLLYSGWNQRSPHHQMSLFHQTGRDLAQASSLRECADPTWGWGLQEPAAGEEGPSSVWAAAPESETRPFSWWGWMGQHQTGRYQMTTKKQRKYWNNRKHDWTQTLTQTRWDNTPKIDQQRLTKQEHCVWSVESAFIAVENIQTKIFVSVCNFWKSRNLAPDKRKQFRWTEMGKHVRK